MVNGKNEKEKEIKRKRAGEEETERKTQRERRERDKERRGATDHELGVFGLLLPPRCEILSVVAFRLVGTAVRNLALTTCIAPTFKGLEDDTPKSRSVNN